MSKPNITTSEVARCLSILESANEPIVAAELARRLFLGGSRETQRRHVRAIIEQLRDNGCWIVATNSDGYLLTDDPHQWRAYQEQRQIGAKRIFAVTHRRKKMLTYPNGQGALFGPVVTCGIG